jgi:hypothetical protein
MSRKKENTAIVGVGVVACAVCCAGPILGVLAAIGLGTAAGFALFDPRRHRSGRVRGDWPPSTCRVHADRDTTNHAGRAHRRAGTVMITRAH